MSAADRTPLVPPALASTLLGPPPPPSEPSRDRGPYVQLYTGTKWHFLDPRPEDVRFADFIGLTRIARYLGGTLIDPYVVAEHCVRGAEYMWSLGHDARTCLAFLVHDPEHVPPGDLPGPMVRYLEKREAEIQRTTQGHQDPTLRIRRLGERAVWTAIGVLDVFDDPKLARHIWQVDRVMLATERRDIMAASAIDWGPLPNPLPERIRPWSAGRAWAEYQEAFRRFGGRLA